MGFGLIEKIEFLNEVFIAFVHFGHGYCEGFQFVAVALNVFACEDEGLVLFPFYSVDENSEVHLGFFDFVGGVLFEVFDVERDCVSLLLFRIMNFLKYRIQSIIMLLRNNTHQIRRLRLYKQIQPRLIDPKYLPLPPHYKHHVRHLICQTNHHFCRSVHGIPAHPTLLQVLLYQSKRIKLRNAHQKHNQKRNFLISLTNDCTDVLQKYTSVLNHSHLSKTDH